MAFDASIAFDASVPFDPVATKYLCITTETWQIESRLLDTGCIVQPLCSTNCLAGDGQTIPEGYCALEPKTPPGCDPYDPDCLPQWWLQLIRDKLSLYSPCFSLGTLWDIISPPILSLCSSLDAGFIPCLDYLIADERKTCWTVTDLLALCEASGPWDGGYYSKCCAYITKMIEIWRNAGEWITLKHCFGLTPPTQSELPRLPKFSMTMQTLEGPARFISRQTEMKPFGVECEPCLTSS